MRFELTAPDGEFVVFRFAHLQLPPTSWLVISSGVVDGASAPTRVFGHTHSIHSSSNRSIVWFSPPVYASRVLLEYHDDSQRAANSSAIASPSCFGFHIDQYWDHALPAGDTSSTTASRSQGKCPTSLKDRDGSSIAATTVSASSLLFDTLVNRKTLPVVRVLVQKPHGTVACSGFVLGCAGHVLTNSHCVATEDEAAHATIELSDSSSPSTVTDTFEAITGAQLVASSPQNELDYALLLPQLEDGDRRRLVEQFGFLSLRSDGAHLGERVFIPQFPGSSNSSSARDKRVAVKVHDEDGGGSSFGRVTSVSTVSCNGRNDSVGYALATSGGSSGAPVIAHQDMAVVGLHYCAGAFTI